MSLRRPRVLWLLAVLPLAACLSGQVSTGEAKDGGSDGGPPLDAGLDAGPDAGGDAGANAGFDAGPDAGPDGGSDAGSTSTSDAGPPLSDGGCVAETEVTCACSGASAVGTSRCLADGSAGGACTCVTYGAEFYVSPTGSDTAAGTLSAPFLTLERAQTAVRALIAQGLPTGGVVVWLRGGVYPRQSTFALTSDDSGDAMAPVVYRGYPGETARLIGGVPLDAGAFQPGTAASPVWSRLDPTAQGQVVAANLTTLGITDFGALAERGFGRTGVPAALELFIDGQRMPLGRWPDIDDLDGGAFPDPNGAQVTVYGTGIFPDVTGSYVQDSVQDGVSSFTRQGLVDGGLSYHLYRNEGTGSQNYISWFLTTNTSGYPAGTDPFFFNYQPQLSPLTGAQGGLGTPTFTSPTAVLHGYAGIASVPTAASFAVATNRTARWTQAPDPWAHGYFFYPWADAHVPLSIADPTSGTLNVTETPNFGLATTLQGGGPTVAYAYNLLEEITEPGEWYLDRSSGILYLWPPSNLASRSLVVSVLSAPLVTVTGASNVTLEALTFEATRTNLITLAGGSANVQVIGCTLRDSGDAAATVADGNGNVFDGDLIHDTGEDGVDLAGGDRPTLTPSNNTVQNSDIHDFSQTVACYTPAVSVMGDGSIVQHNVIHDAPHAAILFGTSSQSLIQYNEIYNVLNFSSDSGAIYAWSDWGSYGNLIQYNFLHDLQPNLSGYGIHAIYLDGCLSGPTVVGNVIANIDGSAILHNGGHDVTMRNNLVAGADVALATYAACNNSTSITCDDGGNTTVLEQLNALNYQQDPWASTYPTCATIPDSCATITTPGSKWLTPYNSVFTDNVAYGTRTLYTDDSTTTVSDYATFDNNLQGQDPLFVDAGALDFNLQPSSPAFALPGYMAIPFDSIGIQH